MNLEQPFGLVMRCCLGCPHSTKERLGARSLPPAGVHPGGARDGLSHCVPATMWRPGLSVRHSAVSRPSFCHCGLLGRSQADRLFLLLSYSSALKGKKTNSKASQETAGEKSRGCRGLTGNVVLRSSGRFPREQPPSGVVLSPGDSHVQRSQGLSLLTRTLGSYTTEKPRAILTHFSRSCSLVL